MTMLSRKGSRPREAAAATDVLGRWGARRRKPARASLAIETLEDRCLLTADVVLAWNELLLQANANDHGLAAPDQPGPTKTARAMAIVQAAVYDAVNSIDGSYTPYLLDVEAPRTASKEAAASVAAHDTLVALYPQQRALFDAALREWLAGIPNVPRRQGVAVGRAVADYMMDWRSADGSQLPDPPYRPGTRPGEHRPDPLHPNQGYYAVGWQNVAPFAIADVFLHQVPSPPALNSPAYTAAYNEVLALGAEDSAVRTEEQTLIGIWWGYDGSPGLGTPPRLYNQITRTLADQMGNSMIENARLFALINLAMADAGLASWNTKYDEDFWRPIVGIREGDRDGNPRTRGDRNWRPLGAPCSNGCGAVTNFTPPFPAYTSGHATFGAAMFRILANFYGTDEIPFSFTSDEYNGVTTDQFGNVRPVVTRSFSTLSQAAEENGQSRIYLGIHWSFDKVWGIEQGNVIADYVFGNYLLPQGSQPGGDFELGADELRALTEGRLETWLPLASLVANATPVQWQPAESGRDQAFASLTPVSRDADGADHVSLQAVPLSLDLLSGSLESPTLPLAGWE